MINHYSAFKLFIISVLTITLSNIAHGTTIYGEPLSQEVNIASLFSLNIVVSDVIDLYSYQFDINYDASKIKAISIGEGSFLPGVGTTLFIPGTVDNNIGTITFTSDSLLDVIPGATGSGILATMTFDASGIGTSSVSLSNTLLLNSNLNDITASTGNDVSITVKNSSTIPEPSTLTLMGVGIYSIIFLLVPTFRRGNAG